MASGRVGGTKSRLSGQLGDVYYSARRESDGSYTQVVSPMPEGREDALTPEVVRQRILMSICYKYLSAINYIIENSFRDDQPPTLNMQEFVRANIPILRAKLDQGDEGIKPIWFYDYGDTALWPAPVVLSSMDKVMSWFGTTAMYHGSSTWRVEIDLYDVYNGWTVRQWMEARNINIGDVGVVMIQVMDRDATKNRIYTSRLVFDPIVSLETVLTVSNFWKMFRSTTEVPFEWYGSYTPDGRTFKCGIRYTKANTFNVDQVGASCTINSAKRGYRWLRSQSQFYTVHSASTDLVLRKSFEEVWDTWYTFRL